MPIYIASGWSIAGGWSIQGGPPPGTQLSTNGGLDIATLAGDLLVTI